MRITPTRIVVALLTLAVVAPATGLAQDGHPDSLCIVQPVELEPGTPVPGSVTLDGRLGGTRASFESRYFVDGTFQQDGCGSFSDIGSQTSADGTSEIVTYIDLWADRDEDLDAGTIMTEPDEANWSPEDALAIAFQLLPPDTVMRETTEMTEAGNILFRGYSGALAGVTTLEHYAYYESPYAPGDVEVLIFPADDGTIWSIVVKIAGAS